MHQTVRKDTVLISLHSIIQIEPESDYTTSNLNIKEIRWYRNPYLYPGMQEKGQNILGSRIMLST